MIPFYFATGLYVALVVLFFEDWKWEWKWDFIWRWVVGVLLIILGWPAIIAGYIAEAAQQQAPEQERPHDWRGK